MRKAICCGSRSKKRLPKLKALLAEASSHWGYEDPVYRFYHASFKVCFLTRTTLKIVGALQELAPHLKLNPDFEQIIAGGTERDFKRSRNKDYTRCIVEAFFHARFMLEMAVRYANLPEISRGAAERLGCAPLSLQPAMSARISDQFQRLIMQTASEPTTFPPPAGVVCNVSSRQRLC